MYTDKYFIQQVQQLGDGDADIFVRFLYEDGSEKEIVVTCEVFHDPVLLDEAIRGAV